MFPLQVCFGAVLDCFNASLLSAVHVKSVTRMIQVSEAFRRLLSTFIEFDVPSLDLIQGYLINALQSNSYYIL